MKTRAISGCFLVVMLVGLLSACREQPAPTPVVVGPAHVSIIDVNDGRPNRPDVVILNVEIDAEQEQDLEDLCRIAKTHFPDGEWVNFGPDSSYREITISCDSGEFVLQSWHPLFEMNPNLVATSNGVTSLNGQSREQVLGQDDAAYVAQRNAFDEIERELRRRFVK